MIDERLLKAISAHGKNVFRGTNKDGCKFYGSLMYLNGKPHVHEDNGKFILHSVAEESVGQYVGKKDKNGVPIFEGDILRFEDDESVSEITVKYYPQFAGFLGESPVSCLPEDLDMLVDYEIVGSVYDREAE